MIRFSLKCPDDHHFESWFQSGLAFDKVKAAGLVTCPTCGSTSVEKMLMAPPVRTGRAAATRDAPQSEGAAAVVSEQAPSPPSAPEPSTEELEQKISALKAHVEATSDYVGKDFAKEARAMHGGETPERSIYGEANLKEAKALIEEGIPLAPLPFIPARKVN